MVQSLHVGHELDVPLATLRAEVHAVLVSAFFAVVLLASLARLAILHLAVAELGTLLAAMVGVAVLAVPTVVAFAWFTSFTAINLKKRL